MKTPFKPKDYNSLSPYLVVEDATALMALMQNVFNAREKRKYQREDGSILHAEMRIDDSIVMSADSTDTFQATQTVLHLYVPDVMATYGRALEAGCEGLEVPVNKKGDPDKRGSFRDPAGNFWSISTQVQENP